MINKFRRYITGVFCVPTNVLTSLGPTCITGTRRTCKVATRRVTALAPLRDLTGFVPIALKGVLNNVVFIKLPLCLVCGGG